MQRFGQPLVLALCFQANLTAGRLQGSNFSLILETSLATSDLISCHIINTFLCSDWTACSLTENWQVHLHCEDVVNLASNTTVTV